ncbi:MAG: 16S rRNA (cytosine(967)-C(5))-methyltransferase RsmB [candidate division Zixibacteria bacterium]|nr:16S rRNA (cytosine(967)-C(5))-methyltransferase RsmB [candidate division Zixibacteria bacterium]
MTTPRETAMHALCHFETYGAFVKDDLDDRLRQSRFDQRDRAFATELTYGTLRWRGRIDWVLEQCVRTGIASLTPPIRNILRLGVYQTLLMEGMRASAAVHESVEMAKKYGHPGTVRLTNAVLRTVVRRKDDFTKPPRMSDSLADLSVWYSYPCWLVKRWVERYGYENAAALCEAGNRTPPVVIRVNRLKTTPSMLADRLATQGVHAEPGRYLEDFLVLHEPGDVRRLAGYAEGWFQVQDESAGLAVRLLEPRPGETVVDLCCAPGGKIIYIAELMSDRGRIVGADVSPGRLRRLQEHVRRMGFQRIATVATDGCNLGLRLQADRVLVDAPCSGLGTVARRAELRWRRRPEDLEANGKIQTGLLEQAGRLVRPGGVLVYSTCTIEPEENEYIVEEFCRRHPEFRAERPETWPSACSDMLGPDYRVRTLPSVHRIDGSFAVRMKRE